MKLNRFLTALALPATLAATGCSGAARPAESPTGTTTMTSAVAASSPEAAAALGPAPKVGKSQAAVPASTEESLSTPRPERSDSSRRGAFGSWK